MAKTNETLKPGDVIRVRHWPNTQGQRFRVLEVRHVPGSKWPHQVHTRQLERVREGRWFGFQFRAFPLDRCRKDEEA